MCALVYPEPLAYVGDFQLAPGNLENERLGGIDCVVKFHIIEDQEDFHPCPCEALITIDKRVISSE